MPTFGELDHSTQRVNDLILTYRFYRDVLGEVLGGAELDTISRLTTEEIVSRDAQWERVRAGSGEARNRGEGASHGAVDLGKASIPVFLRTEQVQEAPPEQLVGRPRMAFAVSPEQMERAIEMLRKHKVPFEGPVEHSPPCPGARSLYFKDPSSNFLELCCPR